ncbi:hypothetical protein BDP81DRAFT_396916 [Colletotrichum phormii]|uniref:Uncharacterized protein n=1 Tax=Colletotrichum phormii TaxID=359342 RepID=A0AAJ0ECF3_9PEZI|nr:uncharacterized protein BDP81DRAFT_396916 [Colletotrichum phormii]KAK1633533.1 hypothetical protein BDP81DRAFT_396916 [Colletotrichum phormii]
MERRPEPVAALQMKLIKISEFTPEAPSNSHQEPSDSKADSKPGLDKKTPTPLAEAHFQDCLDSQESSRAPTPTSSETPSLGEAFGSLKESSTLVIVSGDKALDNDDETFSPPALVTILTIFCLWCVFEF